MNFNIKLLALFGFIGTVFGGITPLVSSTDLTKLERKLSSATSGKDVKAAMNTNFEDLADLLDEMASKPEDYTVPMSDQFYLYRFFGDILAKYINRKIIKDMPPPTESIASIEARLAAKDNEVAELTKKNAARWFASEPGFEESKKARNAIQEELTRAKEDEQKRIADEKYKAAVAKFEKFIERFKAKEKFAELKELEYVKEKLVEEDKANKLKASMKGKVL